MKLTHRITFEWLATVVFKWIFILVGIAALIGVCSGRWQNLLALFCCFVMAWTLHKDQRQEEKENKIA